MIRVTFGRSGLSGGKNCTLRSLADKGKRSGWRSTETYGLPAWLFSSRFPSESSSVTVRRRRRGIVPGSSLLWGRGETL